MRPASHLSLCLMTMAFTAPLRLFRRKATTPGVSKCALENDRLTDNRKIDHGQARRPRGDHLAHRPANDAASAWLRHRGLARPGQTTDDGLHRPRHRPLRDRDARIAGPRQVRPSRGSDLSRSASAMMRALARRRNCRCHRTSLCRTARARTPWRSATTSPCRSVFSWRPRAPPWPLRSSSWRWRCAGRKRARDRVFASGTLPALLVIAVQALSVALLLLIVAAGLFGHQNPFKNLAPVAIWVIWWVGLGLVSAFVGNLWALLNPFAAIFELRRMDRGSSAAAACRRDGTIRHGSAHGRLARCS